MINFRAIYSIIAFRLKEFCLEYQYSLLAPVTTNILFILVFLTIENYYSLSIDSISFVQFIAPGLIIMIVAQESYDNPSVTLVNMKQIGSFDDWLIAPISRIEILISLLISSIIMGFIIAILKITKPTIAAVAHIGHGHILTFFMFSAKRICCCSTSKSPFF